MVLDDLVAKMCAAQRWKSSQTGDGWGLEVPQPKGRSQTVFASLFKDDGAEMVRYMSVIGDAATIDGSRAKMALELNSKLPHGCLAILNDQLVMTDTRPLATTTPESSAKAVKYLAMKGDTFERQIYGTDKH